MKMRRVIVITPSRLHFALIDLNGSLGRVDGGIGLSLDYPGFKIIAQYSDTTNVIGTSEVLPRANRILSLLKNRCNINNITIKIEENIPSHVGLGSGTQLSLGITKAVCTLFDIDLNYQEMAFIVGRGGTSGIGVAAFSQGGFIVDGGHEFAKDKYFEGIKSSFLPSSASEGIKPPPVIVRYDFPDWDILVTIPDCKHISGEDEVRLFQTLCPMPLEEVQAISHIVLLKLLPSVVQNDIVSFGEAIDLIQKIGWKKVEIEKQDEVVRQIMSFLRENGGYGVGLSSWGPAIFCFGQDLTKLKIITNEYLKENRISGHCFITHANNFGATVIKEDGIYRDSFETADYQGSLR